MRIDLYAVWNLDILLGSIGDERTVIGCRILDIEDTIGNLVGHCFVAPMGTVEIHRIAKNHHFGW